MEAWAGGWELAVRDLQLTAEDAHVRLQMHPLHGLAGRIVDRHTGAPVTDVLVRVQLRSDEDGIGRVWTARELRIRSERGRFALGGAPEEARLVRLLVSAESYLETTTDWCSARAWIDDLVVELGRTGLGESFVTARVVDASTGDPVPGTRLLLVDAETTMDSVRLFDGDASVSDTADVTGELPYGGARAATDEEGRGRIATRHEGPARLLVVPPGQPAFLSEGFELRNGSETDLGTLSLRPGGTIEGRVLTGGSDTVVRSITVTREGGPTLLEHVEEDGAFRVEGLRPGSYRVSALGRLPEPSGEGTAVVPQATASVRLDGLETVHVDLHCGSGLVGRSIRGRIARVGDLDELRVVLLDVDLSPVCLALADPDGTFELTDVEDGDYTLAVVGRGAEMDRFAATWTPLEMPRSERAPFEVELASSRVELHAPGAGGHPFSVTAHTSNPLFDELVGAALRGTLDEDGQGTVWGLPAGRYRFRAASGERTVDVPAEGGTFQLRF